MHKRLFILIAVLFFLIIEAQSSYALSLCSKRQEIAPSTINSVHLPSKNYIDKTIVKKRSVLTSSVEKIKTKKTSDVFLMFLRVFLVGMCVGYKLLNKKSKFSKFLSYVFMSGFLIGVLGALFIFVTSMIIV